MKKVNVKFRSVRLKLFLTLSIITILIIALLIVMNSIVLESFYTMSKINTVKQEFQVINNLYNKNDPSVLIQVRRDALANNFDIMIENENYIVEFSTNENFTNAINQNNDITAHFNIQDEEQQRTIFTRDNYIIRKVESNGLNCILLTGRLDNGYRVYIQIPISAIEESVKISNNLLLIIGLISIIIAGIAASYVSKKFTNQILELNVIANKMSKLDFSQKYQPTDSDDEINELGNSINLMSEKLESTIKQLRSSNNQLERDIEEKSKIDDMRKQFISDVSHELKTPIALIQGYAEGLIENVNNDEESRKFYAEVILDESNKMDTLVKQLLEFNNEKFDIVELINEVIRKCKVMIDEKNIQIKFEHNGPIQVFADDFYIEQVVTNYFTNAIKHAKEVDGIKQVEVKITENTQNGKVRISVINTGDNIAEEHIDKIWGRFYKEDSSRNRNDGGTGIGLALVKAIMNNYKNDYGVINLENGVEFYFELDKGEKIK